MPTTHPTHPPRAITARAAENGLILSGCICALLLFCGLASVFAPASLLLWAGSLAMPVVIYKILSRSYREAQCSLNFAEIWAEGIASFFLGSLVPAVIAYLLLRFAFPDFIAHQIDSTIVAFKQLGTPEGDQYPGQHTHANGCRHSRQSDIFQYRRRYIALAPRHPACEVAQPRQTAFRQ